METVETTKLSQHVTAFLESALKDEPTLKLKQIQTEISTRFKERTAKTSEKSQTEYQRFMSVMLKELGKTHPEYKHKERMSAAQKAWSEKRIVDKVKTEDEVNENKKAPTEYQIFLKECNAKLKEEFPDMSPTDRKARISLLWAEKKKETGVDTVKKAPAGPKKTKKKATVVEELTPEEYEEDTEETTE